MKICPVCGAKNNRHSLICGNCGASFESTPELQQAPGEEVSDFDETVTPYKPAVGGPDMVTAYRPAVGGPAGVDDGTLQAARPLGGDNQKSDEPLTMVGQPLNAQSQVSGGPQTDPYGTINTPRKLKYRETPDLAPVKSNVLVSSIGSIIMLIILLSGGWYCYQRFVVKPRPVLEATRTFIDAGVQGNWQAMQSTVDQNSSMLLAKVYKNMTVRRIPAGVDFFLTRGEGFTEGKQYKVKVVNMTETTAKVLISPGPDPIPAFDANQMPVNFKDGYYINLTNVNGQWKINLMQFVIDLASCGDPYDGMAKYFVSR
ncbi:MAG: hypothetical protein ABFD46_02100 [Armatimonadota bacterium]